MESLFLIVKFHLLLKVWSFILLVRVIVTSPALGKFLPLEVLNLKMSKTHSFFNF